MKWRLTLDCEYVDEQYAYNGRDKAEDIEDVEILPSYFVTNAGIGHDLSDYIPGLLEVSLEVKNLTGEVYSFQPGYPMPGRTVFVAARLGTR